MQNRTDIIGGTLLDRVRHLARGHQELFRHLGSLIGGFVMAGSYILGGVAPFGAAFCAAVPGRYGISAALGAVLGYLVRSATPDNMKYIVTVLMIAAARWLFEPKAPARVRVLACSAISGFSLAVASAAVLVLSNATLYDVVMGAAELLLICGATYFFSRALAVLGRDWSGTSRSDLSCLVIALAVALMGLTALRLGSFSLGRILAVAGVMLCARYGREAGGAVAGLTAGIALGLAGGDFGFLLITMGFGGLVAGLFGGMGRVATAASFIFVNTINALFSLEYMAVYNSILEVFVASVVFMAIPQSLVAGIGLQKLGQAAARPDTATQKAMCERLEDMSGALKEISTTTQQVSQRLSKLETSNYHSVCAKVAEQVCLHCGMKSACWQLRYAETQDSMNKCIDILKREGSIAQNKMPKRFTDRCCKPDIFNAALNTQFHEFVSKEGVQRKVAQVRSVVTDQFEGVALMLDEIAGELGNMRLMDPVKSKRVQEYFEKEGITARQVVCYADEFDRMSLEFQIPNFQAAKLQKSKAALDLCALLEADFDLPQVTGREKYTSVLFSEKASFTVELGAYQIAAGSGRLCGDAYNFIRNKGGRAHFILSDGMGSGGSAAVDSAMASGLITRLISVGIGYEAALKMVNSALLIKSGEESLATIDICSLDLFTGKAEFYKAGAAPTFVIKGGKAAYVESTSLPAGILRGVAFEKSGITLHEGDMVVMVSDGVIVTGSDWVKSELETNRDCDVQRLCEMIATTAKMRRNDGREDDITVLAAQVMRGV